MDQITGTLLKELREEHKISQTELARLTGISQAHIAKIEGEKVNPRLSTVNAIIAVLQKHKKTKSCKEIMSKRLVTAAPQERVHDLIHVMKRHSISQVPVLQKTRQVGSISEATLIKNMNRRLQHLRVIDILDDPFPLVNANDPITLVAPLLEHHPAVLVAERGKILGIITKANLLGTK